MNELFNLYRAVLIAHIGTKTTYSQFHEKSEGWYELLFEVFHSIAEKRQDIEIDKPLDEEKVVQETYDNIEKAKKLVESMIKEKNSPGMDNLLRWLVDKLEWACGNARAFIEEEKDEYETKKVLPKSK